MSPRNIPGERLKNKDHSADGSQHLDYPPFFLKKRDASQKRQRPSVAEGSQKPLISADVVVVVVGRHRGLGASGPGADGSNRQIRRFPSSPETDFNVTAAGFPGGSGTLHGK